jgi:hypothetical protein
MGIYESFQNIDNFSLFKFVSIMIIFLFFFIKKNVKLNIILAIILASIIILYIYDKDKTLLRVEKNEYNEKHANIKPEIHQIKEDYDIIDFLFSIQDLHAYNPEAFEEMIDNIDSFLTTKDIIFKEDPHCESHYQIAENKKNNALNSLHSIIFKLPVNRPIMDKLVRAHKRLETILNNHINEMYDKCNHLLIVKGHTVNNTIINTGPKPANHYFDKDFTYQFY